MRVKLQRLLVAIWAGSFAAWTAALLIPIPSGAVRSVGGAGPSFWISKVMHVGGYAVLALMTAFLPVRPKLRWVCLAALVLHGGLTEYLQQFVQRGSSWRDFGLDCLGCVLGTLLAGARWYHSFSESPQVHLEQQRCQEHAQAPHL